jgi:hypothetical protein
MLICRPNRRRLADGFPKEIELAEAWNNVPGASDVIPRGRQQRR